MAATGGHSVTTQVLAIDVARALDDISNAQFAEKVLVALGHVETGSPILL